MTVVTISSKFRVVIPRQIRESLGLKPGQKVEVFQHLDRIECVPVRPVSSMRGFLEGIDTSVQRNRSIE